MTWRFDNIKIPLQMTLNQTLILYYYFNTILNLTKTFSAPFKLAILSPYKMDEHKCQWIWFQNMTRRFDNIKIALHTMRVDQTLILHYFVNTIYYVNNILNLPVPHVVAPITVTVTLPNTVDKNLLN